MTSFRDHLIPVSHTIEQALVQLNQLGKDAILFVLDENDSLIGALTDGDVRRGLIKGVQITQSVNLIIQPNPHFIQKGETDIYRIIEYRENNYRIIPVVDKSGKVINVINFREFRSFLPIDVVIMAGGKGQRLMPLTATKPKPLLKVGDKPIIDHNVTRLSLYGITEFWISIKYLGEQIEEYFGNGLGRNINIKYLKEDEPLGTIGAVSKIENFHHDYVLVTNSDILTNIDYEHFFLDFLKNDADLSVVTIPYQVNVPYAVLETEDGWVKGFTEKPSYIYYSNGGIYLMKKEILSRLPKNTFYNTTDLMEEMIRNGKRVYSYPLAGYWLDIGSPNDYEKAKIDINNIKL
ncbi:hypothetical protein KACHI17_12580 [Sediminibacterium sp. KACHI17]|uniref:CBS domain-containing protein n=1 Tax=Sediminibacterium sp. KACHI17 TaxID=1751071 RepID=A0AAT9GIF5_9BACT